MKKTSIGSISNRTRIEELEGEICAFGQDESLTAEDKENSIRLKEKQIFGLKELEAYCTERDIEFEMQNLTVDTFNSKMNVLSEEKIPIWFDSLKNRKILAVFQKCTEHRKMIRKRYRKLFTGLLINWIITIRMISSNLYKRHLLHLKKNTNRIFVVSDE